MLFYKTIVIISFICGASTVFEASPRLSDRSFWLLANVTTEINHLNATLVSAFIPIDDFKSEMEDVITASLNSDDPEIQKYMHENQYLYWSVIYRLITDEYLIEVVKAYDGLAITCKGLIEVIDNKGKNMEEILKKRGCSDEQIKAYLDRYYEKMHYLFMFQLSYLDRKRSITNTIGSKSFFIHQNIVSFLYDCLDTSDVACYQNVSMIKISNVKKPYIFGISRTKNSLTIT